VEIARKNFDEDVKITLSELPDGLEVVNGETQTIAKKKTTITLQLKADKDAKSVKNHKDKVHAEGGGVKTNDQDTLEATTKGNEQPIDDSKKVKKDDNGDNGDVEANLKQARENLEKAAKKQLEEANEALKKVKEKLAKASGEAKENLEK